MKIGILIDELIPGGVQKVAIEEVKGFSRMGFQCELVVIHRKPHYSNVYPELAKDIHIRFLSDKMPFLRYAFKFPIFHYFSSFHIQSLFVTPFLIKRNQYDLIITHNSSTTFTAWSLWKIWRIPYFYFIWDPIFYVLEKAYKDTLLKRLFFILKPVAKVVERILISNAQEVILGSSVHREILKSLADSPCIVPPGCYPSDKPITLQPGTIVSFTRWEKKKNPKFLLKILEKIPSLDLYIAGSWISDKDFVEFREEVKNLNLAKRVEIGGHYDEHAIPDICSRGFACVNPNFEGFGMGILEAAACGSPIIIPRGSGVNDLLIHGEHGFFPEEGNLDEYVQYIRTLMDDFNLAVKMGESAFEAASVYSWANHVKGLERLAKRVKDDKESASFSTKNLGSVK